MKLDSMNEKSLLELRENLYLQEGYIIIRSFIDKEQASHIVNFWSKQSNPRLGQISHQFYPRRGCGNRSATRTGRVLHYNFFWNPPLEPFSYVVAWEMQRLRNLIEGNVPCLDFLAVFAKNKHERKACSHRIVGTTNGWDVPLHVDSIDHSKLQCSLNLTEWGADYREGGFLLRTSAGVVKNLSCVENLKPGDLVVFKYSNEHGVLPTTTEPGHAGFWRMILPIETLAFENALHRIKSHIKHHIRRVLPRLKTPSGVMKGRFPVFKEDVIPLMETALQCGMAPAEIYHPNGFFSRWSELRDWQFNILLKYGLKPEHSLLDIGCGVQRLGLKMADFLENDRYCGIDAVKEFIEAGRKFHENKASSGKTYHLLHDVNFSFEKFNRRFDYAIAQSVLNHLSKEQIRLLFSKLKPVMKPGGIFIWTIQKQFHERERAFVHSGFVPMVNTYHRNTSYYKTLANDIGFTFRELGREGHVSQTACLAVF